MIIAIITDAWHPQVNGVVRTLTETKDRLERKGHTVLMVTPDMFPGFNAPFLPGMRIPLPPYGMKWFLETPDMVHIATEGVLGLAARNYCERKGYNYTTAYHTNFPAYLRNNFKVSENIGYSYMRWFHKHSKAVMVPTPSMIDTLRENSFENLVLWGRGVDETVFNTMKTPGGLGEDHPRPYWLNVGRVSKEKNLDAFLGLPLAGTKFIVGDGPDTSRLRSAYPETQFLGNRSGNDLAQCYRDADVFVFPSHFDTFGLVNAEAISCGTPVAAFPSTGPKDIIKQGITGFLDNDLETACIRSLSLRNVSDNFSWDFATDQFVTNLVMKT